MWSDHLPDAVAGAVQTHVSRARQTFPGIRLVTMSGGYSLEVAPGELDAEQFERLVEVGTTVRAEDPAEALDAFDRAIALWRGPDVVSRP